LGRPPQLYTDWSDAEDVTLLLMTFLVHGHLEDTQRTHVYHSLRKKMASRMFQGMLPITMQIGPLTVPDSPFLACHFLNGVGLVKTVMEWTPRAWATLLDVSRPRSARAAL
jgi:hypothetical protein